MALGKGGLCRVPRIRHSAKKVMIFFRNFLFMPTVGSGHSKVDSFVKCLPGPALGKGAGGT